MSIAVTVGLLSGRTATVRAGLDESVAALSRRAQTALGVGKGHLVDSSGSILDEGCSDPEGEPAEWWLFDIARAPSSSSGLSVGLCCHSWRWIGCVPGAGLTLLQRRIS